MRHFYSDYQALVILLKNEALRASTSADLCLVHVKPLGSKLETPTALVPK